MIIFSEERWQLTWGAVVVIGLSFELYESKPLVIKKAKTGMQLTKLQ